MPNLDGYSTSLDDATTLKNTRADLPDFLTSDLSPNVSLPQTPEQKHKSSYDEKREIAELLRRVNSSTSPGASPVTQVDSSSDMVDLSLDIKEALKVQVKEVEVLSRQIPAHSVLRDYGWELKQDVVGTKVYTHKLFSDHQVYILPDGIAWEHHIIKGSVMNVFGLGNYPANLKKHLSDFYLLNK